MIVEDKMIDEEFSFTFDSFYSIPADIESYDDQNQNYCNQSSCIGGDLFSSF